MEPDEIVSEAREQVALEGEFSEEGGTLGAEDRADAAVRSHEPPEDARALIEALEDMRL